MSGRAGRGRAGARGSGWASLLATILGALLALGPANAGAVYPVPADPGPAGLAGHVERLVDPTGALRLAEVRERRFQPMEAFHSGGYDRDIHWYRFVLRETVPDRELLLAFEPLYLNRIDVYLLGQNAPASGARHYRFGDHAGAAERFGHQRGYVLPLDLDPGETVELYVRVSSNSAMTFRVRAWNQADHERSTSLQEVAYGTYFGLLAGLALVFLPLAALLRRPEYLAFATLTLALLTTYLGVFGYVRLLWPGAEAWVPDVFTGAGTLGITLGASLVFITLLRLARTARWLYRVLLIQALVAALGIPWVTTPVYGYFAVASQFLGALTVPLATALAAHQTFITRDSSLAFYTLGFLVSLLGAGVMVLTLQGVLPLTGWSLHAYFLGTVLQMAFLAMGMGIEWLRSVRAQATYRSWAESAEARAAVLHNTTRFLSHELMNPLAGAQRALEMIQRRPGGMAERQLERVAKARGRLEEIEEIARVFLGRQSREGGVCPRDVVEDAVSMSSAPREITVEPEGAEGVRIPGSRTLITHALRNLIDNALTHGGGHCRVGFSVDQGWAHFLVEDEGPGMPEALIERLNGMGEVNLPGRRGGVSGLTLVKFFVELHKGVLDVANRRDGGLSVELMLPAGRR